MDLRLTRLGGVATWEDGPEYAPHERPQYFADAPLPPLEQAPRALRPADGQPTARPRFDEPTEAVAPLAALVPEPPDERDPNRPFEVVTATLTSASGWGEQGSPGSQPFVPTAPFATAPAGLAPTALTATPTGGAPWPLLEQPAPGGFPHTPRQAPRDPRSAAAPEPQDDPYAYPAPGTPGWFAPPPTTYGDQQQPGRVGAKQVVEAATPGLCICLAVGGVIYVLAPVMLVLAVFLSTRVQVAQRTLRIAFRSAAGAVGFFAVVGLFRSVFDGEPWWSFVGLWSLLICWVLLGVLLLSVYQALARPRPPTSNPWG